jgi:hypothetical protein
MDCYLQELRAVGGIDVAKPSCHRKRELRLKRLPRKLRKARYL